MNIVAHRAAAVIKKCGEMGAVPSNLKLADMKALSLPLQTIVFDQAPSATASSVTAWVDRFRYRVI
jgi:hypothetical protein